MDKPIDDTVAFYLRVVLFHILIPNLTLMSNKSILFFEDINYILCMYVG